MPTVDEMLLKELAEYGWEQAEPWLRDFLPPFLKELRAVGLEYTLVGSVVGPWLAVNRPNSKGMHGSGFEDMEILIEKEEFMVGAGNYKGRDVVDGMRPEYAVKLFIRQLEGPECIVLTCHEDPCYGVSIKSCTMLIEVISKIDDTRP